MAEKIRPRSFEDYVHLIQAVEALEDLTEVQCNDGNWNCNSYMHGMANGMIFALSLFHDCCPEYLESPENWLDDELNKEKAIESK